MHIPHYFSRAEHLQFGSFYLPDQSQWPSNWVLVCPPFGEELNKSRSIIAAQSRELCSSGCGVLVLDLHGTGDSPYSLDDSESDWNQWAEQILSAMIWLGQQGSQQVTLWGIRLGALMALDVYQRVQALDATELLPRIEHMFFWQPVLNGKTFMTQFLRLRTAASMMAGDEPETVKGLRELAIEKQVIDVAGYRLPQRLIEQIDGLKAEQYEVSGNVSIQWFDVSRQAEKPLAPVQAKLIDRWHHADVDVQVHRIEGDAFWAAQELVSIPALIKATSDAMSTMRSKAAANTDGLSHAAREGDESAANVISMQPNSGARIQAVTTNCCGHSLTSMIHYPKDFNGQAVLVVVGGPQYRVGSHRQFFELAQSLADEGYLVGRFDCRGMGDSEGEFPGFEFVDDDISAAIDGLYSAGLDISSLSLWGLCDGATAIGFYAANDARVKRLVMLNPWVRSDEGLAKAKLKHYYGKRLFQKALWVKLISGQLELGASLKSLKENLCNSLGVSGRGKKSAGINIVDNHTNPNSATANPNRERLNHPRDRQRPLIEQLYSSVSSFKGGVLLLLSGRDLTAQEFDLQVQSFGPMKKWLDSSQVELHRFDEADHTFSRSRDKRRVEEVASQWLGQI